MNAALRRVATGLGLAIVALALLLTRGDGPPPDDADLLGTARPVAEHENGWVSLNAAAELLQWPEDVASASRLEAMARGDAWDDDLAARALAANEFALHAFARIARNPAFQSAPDPASALSGTREGVLLAELCAVRSIAAARTGDAEAALADALLAVRVGQRIAANPNGGLLSTVAGMLTSRVGLRALAIVAPQLALEAERGAELARELRTLRADAAAWKTALATDYQTARSEVLAGVPAKAPPEPEPGGAAARVAGWLPARYLRQPNNSLAFLAARIRLQQARAAEPCAPGPSAGAPLEFADLLRPNALGRRAIAGDTRREETETYRCAYDAQLELTRAAFAVLAFERDRGVLPPSLEALVPAYLEATPLDPFSGRVLGFDRARRLLHSIGSDGIDDGGREPPSAAADEAGALEPRFALPVIARR